MKKIKILLSCLLCLVFVAASGLVGCNGYTYKKTELSHYSYAESERTGDYNTKLFYRNDYDVPLGDPTTIYVDEGPWAGNFYSTGTSGGSSFEIYQSTDFINWEPVGKGFMPDQNHFGQEDFWAPQLLYDKDALWSDYNIEAEEGESGKGLFFLFYSAYSKETVTNIVPRCYYPAVAISKEPGGPYEEFTGTNRNGFAMDASTPVFDIENINPETGINLDENAEPGQELYKYSRSFIDACPYIAPNGDKYLFMARNRVADVSNEIWGVKMKDWVTPDYSTVTRLTSFGYTTTERTEEYNFVGYSMKIDEGPFCYYHEGKYYMTFSIGSTNDKLYPVAQAVGDSPLGPYTKIQPEDGGLVCSPGTDWDLNSSGHHSFFEVGDELWIVYHSYPVLGADGIGSRAQCFERVYFTTNSKGQTVMHANGPTKVIQPLPEAVSGYKNIAPLAEVKATNMVKGSNVSYLTDELIAMHNEHIINDNIPEFEAKGTTEITLTFPEYVTARAIMIYNSQDYMKIFTEIDRIEFSYKDEYGNTGMAYIDNLGFNLDANLVPLDYLLSEDEMEFIDDSYYTMRAGGASVAEFNELSINKIKIKIKKAEGKDGLNISDIVVLGKTA